jgi:hypothetical protein
MSEIDDKNRIKEQFISSQAFHRTPGGHIQEITARERFEPRILKSFDPVTQELYRLLPAMMHTQKHKEKTARDLATHHYKMVETRALDERTCTTTIKTEAPCCRWRLKLSAHEQACTNPE